MKTHYNSIEIYRDFVILPFETDGAFYYTAVHVTDEAGGIEVAHTEPKRAGESLEECIATAKATIDKILREDAPE